jgi:hypothetical protein
MKQFDKEGAAAQDVMFTEHLSVNELLGIVLLRLQETNGLCFVPFNARLAVINALSAEVEEL